MYILLWIVVVAIGVGLAAFIFKLNSLLFEEIYLSERGKSAIFKDKAWKAGVALLGFFAVQIWLWLIWFECIKLI